MNPKTFLQSKRVKELLERAASFAAAPIAIHGIDNGSERGCVASVGGREACRCVNGRRKGLRTCAKDREAVAATALSGNLIAPLFCHMGFVCVTAPLFAEGASGLCLDLWSLLPRRGIRVDASRGTRGLAGD